MEKKIFWLFGAVGTVGTALIYLFARGAIRTAFEGGDPTIYSGPIVLVATIAGILAFVIALIYLGLVVVHSAESTL